MKILYKIGQSIRNPSLKKKFNDLKKSEKFDIVQLEEMQLQKLKNLIVYAYRSPFYNHLYSKNKINLHNINTIADIQKLPIISKEDLLNNKDEIQLLKGFKKIVYSETSGSTGQPLKFYRNEEWDSAHRAAQLRGYSWYGINPWNRNGYLWGYNFSLTKVIKTNILDTMLNRFRLFSYDDKKIKTFVSKCSHAKYLEGYSSMIYEIAKYSNRNNIKLENLLMVKGTSEKIYDSYQEEAEKAFGKKIISEYGASETGIIAYECPYGNMHIVMENVIVEEIENEIIVTNLESLSFPIIRYRLGDFVELDKKTKCKCGQKHYIIKEVKGRVGSLIQGINNNYPSLTLYYVFKNLATNHDIVLNYQAIQKKIGYLELRLSRNLLDIEISLLRIELKKYFRNDLDINVNYKEFIRSKNNKLKDFINLVDKDGF